MIEPVALQDFFITFFSAALIILAGASYALLFAWSKVNPNFRIKIAAYVSYAVLAAAVLELSRAAQFQGYWLIISCLMLIGYFFAPIPLVAMVVHAVYDAGTHSFKNGNHPALAWIIAQAFGNFFGAGVWGFMHTLPQINIFTHGTQWSASHGHLAFFGAYATINIAFFYLAIQQWRGNVWMGKDSQHAWRWKWALGLLNGGVLGMTIALLIAGYEQSFIERAVEGSSWGGYFAAQNHPSFQSAMVWRLVFGGMTLTGFGLLVWDLLTIGKGETRKAPEIIQS